MMRSWLQFMRAQTAPATVLTIIAPYLLAGGDIYIALYLALIATLLHFSSFGHNSLMDWVMGFDLSDPHKRHFPNITGVIEKRDAHRVIHTGLILSAIALITMTIYISSSSIPLIFLLLYMVFGHAYNDGLDKNSIHGSWLSISLCFTSLALYGYTLAKPVIDVTAILIAVWAFLTIFYQIGWEGNLKDIWNPAEKGNLLKKYVVFRGGEIIGVSPKISVFFAFIRLVLNSIILLILLFMFFWSIEGLTFILFFTGLEFFAVYWLHKEANNISDRQKLLNYMGLAEAIEFFRFTSLLGIYTVYLVLYGLCWFIGMNRWLWGTRTGPRV